MLSIKDRLNFYKNKKALRKLRETYQADIKRAKKDGKKANDIGAIVAEMHACCRDNEFEIEKIYTRKLTNKARQLYIEIPGLNDENFWENEIGFHILTDHGKSVLNKRIKAQRREDYEFWIKIILVLIGFIGALTGLVAVISR